MNHSESSAITANVKELQTELSEVYHAVAGLTIELDSARERLSHINEQLEARVRERTQELEAAILDANRANHAKSDFLAAMSHEIRTPMNGVVGMIDLLIQSALDDKQQQMARTIRDSAQALLRIINDILDISKIESGKVELEATEFDLNETVDGVVRLLLPNADMKGIQFTFYVDPQIKALLIGDVYRTRQILFNLVGNAIKFTPENWEHNGRVEIRVFPIGNPPQDQCLLKFEVTDTGIGIPADTLGNLFQKFTQADRSTTRKFGGSGLGLAICKGLAESMGGSIDVSSRLGEGSCFSVCLPFRISEKAIPPCPDLSGSQVILMVDNVRLRKDLECYLSTCHALVFETDSPEELYSLSETATPQIVVFDQQEKPQLESKIPAFLRQLILSCDRNQPKGWVAPNKMIIDNYPLNRDSFIRAVAASTGLPPPEISLVSKPPNYVAPFRQAATDKEASEQNRLILIADDNPQNQMVMRFQLEKLGYVAEIVEDGCQALEAWKKKSYALIMTDCHMPNMDGYELARQIRLLEEVRQSKIIAVTANALQGEAERCLAAGMDDYISKPVDLVYLKQLLRKWLPTSGSEQAKVPSIDLSDQTPTSERIPSATKLDEETPLYDPLALREIIGNNLEEQRQILQCFLASLVTTVSQMQVAYSQSNWRELGWLAHRLKSSARSCGALRLADCCQQLEMAGLDLQVNAAAKAYEHLLELVDLTRQSIPT